MPQEPTPVDLQGSDGSVGNVLPSAHSGGWLSRERVLALMIAERRLAWN
jgi:hypothetical protein